MFQQLWRRLAYLFHRNRFAEELREEMELHVDLRTRSTQDRGQALRQFGNRAAAEDRSREAWAWLSAERLVYDLRQAYRVLRGSPGFTAMAIGTLALGLGINTAIYTMVNAVVFRSLPYPDADRLVSVIEMNNRPDPRSPAAAPRRNSLAPANMADFARAQDLEHLAAYDYSAMNLTGLGTPERLQGELVTVDYFSVLGMLPVMGRAFLPEEDREGGEKVVILNYDFWQSRLGADPAVLSRSVVLDGVPRRVVGVMPRGFRSPAQFGITDRIAFLVPAAPPRELLLQRGDHEWAGIARLKPGATVASAQAELDAIGTGLAKQFPATNKYNRPSIAPLRDDLVRNVRDSMYTLLAAAGLILLITCVNVANLLMVRAMARRHETSVRFALGAGRARIVRMFVAESALLSAAGLAGGVVLGRLLMRLLVVLTPPNTPRMGTVSMDWPVLWVAAAAATLTTIVFGLAPAWHASQANAGDALKAARRSIGGASQVRWRSMLTVLEVALSVILLVGAGLLLKSFTLVMGMDLGFQPDHVMALSVALPNTRYPAKEDRVRFFQQLEERVRALPGVVSAAYANRMPLRGGWGTGVDLENGESARSVDSQAVSPGYFTTLGISALRGRLLTPDDRTGTPAVAVVNQAFVQKLLHGADPMGRRFRRGDRAPWVEIAGVVNDIRRDGKTSEVNPEIYLPAAQTELYPVVLADFAVRSAGAPRQLVNAIQRQVWSIDSELPVTNIRTLVEIIDASVAQRRFQTLLLTIFSLVAVGLAVLGIYGVLAYSVSQRTPELGIRVALGATPAAILAMVMRQAGALIAAGIGLGVAGAYALAEYIQSLLFHVPSRDWWTYAAAAATLAAVALGASLIPARRGSQVDPVIALRSE
jgi:putative ABC transport system permease protein